MGTAAYSIGLSIGGMPIRTPQAVSLVPVENSDNKKFAIPMAHTNILARPNDRDHYAPVVVGHVPPAYSIDYLWGIITFAESQDSPVMMDYDFYTTMYIGGAESFALTISNTLMDDTSFDKTIKNGGFRTRKYGLLDVSLQISRFDPISDSIRQRLWNREPVIIDIKSADGKNAIRGWFALENDDSSGDVSSLENGELSLQLDGDAFASFSWT